MHDVVAAVLGLLEWLAKYGIIDIVFGLGIFTLFYSFIRRHFPRNLPGLLVDTRSEFGNASTVVEGATTDALFVIIKISYLVA